MTKHVRIENGDPSDHKVIVEVWDKGFNGEPDKLNHVVSLDYPTAMATQAIWKERYLVIKEAS